jgi:DNA end-binding protein Ku
MRSMWKGAISFGLVMIPVKLYAATEQKDIAFRQVHREDGGRIRFRRVCSIDGAEVPYEDIAKGYELPDGEMIVLTDEDMADLPLATSKSIEVMHFTPADQLDPILFNRSYYVEPENTGVRAYALLRDALERSGKIAIAQVALRQREALATLRSRDGVLVLETLLWPDEIRAADFGFLDDDIEVRSQELQMASSLIDSMTVDFDPDEYHDRYREALQELVEAKIEGREVLQPQAEEEVAEPTSLADALRASLAAAKGGGAQDGEDAPARKRASAAGGSGGSRTGRASGAAKDDAKAGSRSKTTGSRRTAKPAADEDEAAADQAASDKTAAKSGASRSRKTTPKEPAAPRRPRKRAS